MPLYEYQCSSCQDRIELMQKFTDPAATTCEKCGGELKKLISNTSFVLKGSGWYITDYGRGGSKGAKSGSSEGSTSSESSGSTASESKPASGASETAAAPKESSSPAPASTPAPQAS